MLVFPAEPRPGLLLIARRSGQSLDQVWSALRAENLVGVIATDSLTDTWAVEVAVLPDNRVVILTDRGPEPGPRPERLTQILADRLGTGVTLRADEQVLAVHGDPEAPGADLPLDRIAVVLIRGGKKVRPAELSFDLKSPLTTVPLGDDVMVVPDLADHDAGVWWARSRPILMLDLRAEVLVVNAFLPDDLSGGGLGRRLVFWSRAGWTWSWGAELRPITDHAHLATQTPEHADYVRSLQTFLGAVDRADPALNAPMADALGRAYGLDQHRISRLAVLLASRHSGPSVLDELIEVLGLAPEISAVLTGRLDARTLPGAERGEEVAGVRSVTASTLHSVRADSWTGRWIRFVARHPAMMLIWVSIGVAGLTLLLTDTVDDQPWVALLWVVVGWAVLELPVEIALVRQVRREQRRIADSGTS